MKLLKKDKAFRSFFLASSLVFFAEGLFAFTLIVEANRLSKEEASFNTSLLLILTLIPPLVLMPFLKKFISNRKIIPWSQKLILTRALIAFLIAILPFNIPLYLLMILVYYGSWYCSQPLLDTISESVSRDASQKKISFLHGCWQGGYLASAFLGGLLLDIFSFQTVILLSSLIDFLSFLEMRNLKNIEDNDTEVNSSKEGLIFFLRRRKEIIPALFSGSFAFPLLMGINTILAPFFLIYLKKSPSTLGIVDTLMGLGSLFCGFFLSQFVKEAKISRYVIAMILVSLILMIIPMSKNIPFIIISFTSVGFLSQVIKIESRQVLFKMTDKAQINSLMTFYHYIGLVLAIIILILLGNIGLTDIPREIQTIGLIGITWVLMTLILILALKPKHEFEIRTNL